MRLRALSLVVAALAGLWLACGDDYQESGPLTGDVGAKCFPDGSCKAGLLCLSQLCVSPPEGGLGSSSGSSEAGIDANTEAGGSGDTDSGPDCSSVDQSGVTPGVVCDSDQRCDPGAVCCKNNNGTPWACVPLSDCSAGAVLQCDSPVDCNTGELCCFTVTANATQTCAFATVVRGVCATMCAPKTSPVCDPMHPCNTLGQCRDRTLLLSNGTRVLRRGLCEAN